MALLDYDQDGRLDIFFRTGTAAAPHPLAKPDTPRATSRLFHQGADGRFVDVTEKSGLGDTGYGMGVAMHRSFLTYVATVVQVHVDDAGQVQIKRVDTALDAGTVVNPEMVRQQFEGAAVMGTSLALYGEITATNGVIAPSRFSGRMIDGPNAAMQNKKTNKPTHV